MTHKADNSFFDVKREWSIRKDRILGGYLRPYLPKVATQGKPICIIDGFAGPGKFRDGNPGSPLIIYSAIKKFGRDAKAVFIEANEDLAADLNAITAELPYTKSIHAEFGDCVERVEAIAQTHTVFLYLDPYTVEGIEWESLDRIFRFLDRRVSIELLLNFNASSFVRRGLAALKYVVPDPDPASESMGDIDAPILTSPTVEALDRVVGGNWWATSIENCPDFAAQVASVVEGFCDRLRQRFAEVCFHDILAEPHHKIPKYTLVFASRHCHALKLMNDEVVKSTQVLAEKAAPITPVLFEMRSEDLVPSKADIPDLVMQEARGRRPRGDVIVSVMRARFGAFTETEIRRCITDLIKAKQLQSATGRPRIPDTELIWKSQASG